jgi:AcrR family transcriptional regulator
MARTRQAILDGALRALADHGPGGATMTEIAHASGVAKATLYNHFRTRDDVWAALAQREVDALGARLLRGAQSDLVEALAGAALAVGSHPARAALSGRTLLDSQPTGSAARETALSKVRQALGAAGRVADLAAVDLVLRWLVSQLDRPGDEPTVRSQAAALAAGLSRSPS